MLPDYVDLTLALERAGITAEAAETHGSFCGAAVLLGPHAGAVWLKEMLGEVDPENAAGAEAGKLLAQTALSSFAMLESGEMTFEPLLPDDDEPLSQRTECLALWCQGFMHGVALGNQGSSDAVDKVFGSEVAKEIFADFTEITRAVAEGDDADNDYSDEGERAFVELLEYVRVSAQLVFEDSASLRSAASTAARH
jgi:uncharacterized protein YgfB (UPF0149 family)